MDVVTTGVSPIKRSIDATCRKDEFQPEVLEIEGKSADLFVRFAIMHAKKGTHQIVMEGLSSPDGPHARFSVLVIAKQPYTVPVGDVTLADDAGRSGTLRARRFIKNGSRGESPDFVLEVAWKCS